MVALVLFFFFKRFSFLFLFFLKEFLYFYGCVGSSFLCEGFLQLWQAGATLHRSARASHYRGLSFAEHRLQTRRLSSCGARAQLLRGMWDLPRPGLEPVSPALAGRFSTTAPPEKPQFQFFKEPPYHSPQWLYQFIFPSKKIDFIFLEQFQVHSKTEQKAESFHILLALTHAQPLPLMTFPTAGLQCCTNGI